MTDDIAEGILTLERNSSIIKVIQHFYKRPTVKYIIGLVVSCILISLLL